MGTGEGTVLVIKADDAGMCHAINSGIFEAYARGTITQTSIMAPCPWFAEAAAMARDRAIPIGVHLTLTSEWDGLRWGSLTKLPSVTSEDGTMWRTVPEARQHISTQDAIAELSAQVDAVRAAGLNPAYLDSHVGQVDERIYEAVSTRYMLPYIYPLPSRPQVFDSIETLSDRPGEEKKEWLLEYLATLPAGRHLLVCHPAADEPELKALARPDSSVLEWAHTYRVTDSEVLLDPDASALINKQGIELRSVGDLQ